MGEPREVGSPWGRGEKNEISKRWGDLSSCCGALAQPAALKVCGFMFEKEKVSSLLFG